MAPSGEKSDVPAAASLSTAPLDYKTGVPALGWTTKEKNERSEWFLIAGFIVVVGVGIFGIGILGLSIWVHKGPDLMVDIFVCVMAMLMGLLFVSVSAAGVIWLLRRRPGGTSGGIDHANPGH